MPQILLASVVYGSLLTVQSLGLFEYGKNSDWLSGDDKICTADNCEYLSACAYLQISIAIEFVILSCRVPGFVLAPKNLWGDGRPSGLLFAGVMFANILVSVLAGFGVIIHQVKWADIALIWAYDLGGLLIIDLVKVSLRYWELPWMSAGAADGVLGYPDLPTDQAGNRDSLRSGMGSRSILRSGRSVLRSGVHQASISGGLMGPQARQTSWEPKSSSMLPFPYNLRANSARNFRSF